MPESALWTLIGSLILLALGLTYKWVENAHGLKLSEKEADRLRTALITLEETRKDEALRFRAEIDSLNSAHNKEISNIKEAHQRELDELNKKSPHKKDVSFSLSEKTISILCEIANYENYFKSRNPKAFFVLDETEMSKVLNLSLQEFKYHLEQLTSAYCIERYAGGSYGGLRSQGRAVLHEKNLLPKVDKKV